MANDDGEVDRRRAGVLGRGSTAPTSSSRSPAPPRACRPSRSRSSPGINVNVTLLFSLAAYDAIHEAFIRGLERRVEAGLPIDDVHSVASFFVCRVDTAVDNQLPEGSPLRGKAAVANAKLAYQHFLETTIAGDRWQALAAKGAKVQRPLWASTGTKNPAYSDVLYVDSLIGPDTRQHDARAAPSRRSPTTAPWRARSTPTGRGRDRPSSPRSPRPVSISTTVTHQLELDGVKSFSRLVRLAARDDRGAARGRRDAGRCLSIAERSLENPLRAGLRVGGATVPAVFVIFGATGDLAQRKLLPAIYNLGAARAAAGPVRAGRLLPHRDGRRPVPQLRPGGDRERTRGRRSTSTTGRPSPQMLHYQPGGFDDDADFHALGERLGRIDAGHGTEGNRVYYLSDPVAASSR